MLPSLLGNGSLGENCSLTIYEEAASDPMLDGEGGLHYCTTPTMTQYRTIRMVIVAFLNPKLL